jgi:hypothetical protein
MAGRRVGGSLARLRCQGPGSGLGFGGDLEWIWNEGGGVLLTVFCSMHAICISRLVKRASVASLEDNTIVSQLRVEDGILAAAAFLCFTTT